jgi:hypothetical protein
VTIGTNVTSIGQSAFSGCTSLKSVTIPNSVTSIGGFAFLDCLSLTSITVDASNPAYSSVNGVLFDKAQATLLQFPGGLGGSYTIPNSVTSIGHSAFGYCERLTSVTIPGSVTSIGNSAFLYCTRLTGVYFQGNSPTPTNNSTVFYGDPATVYYLPGTTGWGAMFDGLPTAPWFLPNPVILNHSTSFGVQPGGFGFTISWATNASVVVEAATNLANPVWIPVSTNTLTGGTNYFIDPQCTNYPGRFYRALAAGPFTVGGTVTGLSVGDSITLLDNGGDDLTLNTNGTFTFATPLADGQTYSVTLYTTSGQVACTFTNGSGTISGANVTNVAVSCHYGCPARTGNMDLDMYNAAVSDGTANGGVPAVMLTENGGPFRVTAAVYAECSTAIAELYPGFCKFTHVVGTTSCSSTTFTNGTPVIQFGTLLDCGFGPYRY